MKQTSQFGSAIIWVLMAVILFAAVGVALSYNSRTSSGIVTGEQARAYAQQIIAYGNQLQAAAQRLKIRDIGPTEFGFSNTIYRYQNNNVLSPPSMYPNCTVDSCNIFAASGGGVMPFITPVPATYLDPAIALPTRVAPGHWKPQVVSYAGAGTDLSDVAMVNEYLSETVCMAINNAIGIENPGGRPPVFPTMGPGAGTYSGQTPAILTQWGIAGKSGLCYTNNINLHQFYNYMVILYAN